MNKEELFKLYSQKLLWESAGIDIWIGGRMKSPFSLGSRDNFTLFEKDGIVLFKDFASGYVGDVVMFVMKAMNLSWYDSIIYLATAASNNVRITLTPVIPTHKTETKIEINVKNYTEQGLEYWGKYGIRKEDLLKHKIYQLENWYINNRLVKSNLAFSFVIKDRHKILNLADLDFKWTNNYRPQEIEGWIEAMTNPRTDLLIITKAKKECVFYDRHWGIPAISPAGENSAMNKNRIKKAIEKYARIIVCLDNDDGGRKGTEKLHKEYGDIFEYKFINGAKNVTDLYEINNNLETIWEQLN